MCLTLARVWQYFLWFHLCAVCTNTNVRKFSTLQDMYGKLRNFQFSNVERHEQYDEIENSSQVPRRWMCVSSYIKIDINHSHKKHTAVFWYFWKFSRAEHCKKIVYLRRETHTQWRRMFTFVEKIETIAAADCQSNAETQKSIAANFHFFCLFNFFIFRYSEGECESQHFNGWNWDDFEKY